MPRMMPVFGAVLTMAVAIAWNIHRYPKVWEMVGPGAQLPKSPAVAEATPTDPPVPPVSPPADRDGPVLEPPIPKLPEAELPEPPESPAEVEDRADETGTSDAGAVVKAVADRDVPEDGEAGEDSVAQMPLVPIRAETANRDESKQEWASATGQETRDSAVQPSGDYRDSLAADSAESQDPMRRDAAAHLSAVQRLPPVDSTPAMPAAHYGGRYSAPVYPNTGLPSFD